MLIKFANFDISAMQSSRAPLYFRVEGSNHTLPAYIVVRKAGDDAEINISIGEEKGDINIAVSETAFGLSLSRYLQSEAFSYLVGQLLATEGKEEKEMLKRFLEQDVEEQVENVYVFEGDEYLCDFFRTMTTSYGQVVGYEFSYMKKDLIIDRNTTRKEISKFAAHVIENSDMNFLIIGLKEALMRMRDEF